MKGSQACDRYRPDCRQILANVPELEVTQLPHEADWILQFFCIEEDSCLKEAADQIRYIGKFKKPGAKLIVAGCAANMIGETFLEFKEVDYVIVRKPVAETVVKLLGKEICENKYKISDDMPKTFNIEIGEGCNKSCGHCNFCFNGLARIPVRSMPMDKILEAVKNATDQGARKIDLMSLNTANYGIDFPEHKPIFHELIQKVSENSDVKLINVWSLTVHNMYPELLDELANNPKVNMIEIGIQTGSAKMHKFMNTGATLEKIEEILERLKHKELRTLFIVGHPGESEEDFEETLSLIRRHNLWDSMVNPYILVEGTASSKMEQLSDEVKFSRWKKTEELFEEVKKAYFDSLVGKRVEGYLKDAFTAEGLGVHVLLKLKYRAVTLDAYISREEYEKRFGKSATLIESDSIVKSYDIQNAYELYKCMPTGKYDLEHDIIEVTL